LKEEPSSSNNEITYEDYDDQAIDEQTIRFKDPIRYDSKFRKFTVDFSMLNYDKEEGDLDQEEFLVYTRS